LNAITKYDKFVMLINLFCVEHAGTNWPSFRECLGARGILLAAFNTPEDAIPEDYARAANEFCVHVTHLDYDDMQKPDWLPFGVIDYRRWRHKNEWVSLGYTE